MSFRAHQTISAQPSVSRESRLLLAITNLRIETALLAVDSVASMQVPYTVGCGGRLDAEASLAHPLPALVSKAGSPRQDRECRFLCCSDCVGVAATSLQHRHFHRPPFLPYFPCFPSVTRFGVYPAPCGTARLCFFGFQKIFSALPAKNAERKDFPNLPKKRRLALGSGAPRVASRKSVPRELRANTNRRKTMALYENEITLKGFLGKDAENVATTQQKTFTILSLATKTGYKDKQGNWVNRTEWHRIVAFGKPSEYARNLKKGDYVEVKGEQRTTEFEKEVVQGKNKVKVTFRNPEVHASIVKKLEQPKSSREENLDAEPVTEGDAA
jgi:single-strand DNA-binding protein